MATTPVFALFVVVELDHDTINHILQEAINGTSVPYLWLATDSYEDAPEKKERVNNFGHTPPISVNWTSHFLGWKLEDVAKWIQEKPDSVDLDGHHFAILDAKATEESVLVCKIGDEELQGEALSLHRQPARNVSSFLGGIEPGEWEEQFEGVQGQKKHFKVDYGKGGR